MSEFVTVADEDEIPRGSAKAFSVGGKLVAVFHTEAGEFHAIDDLCPHQGASLSAGHVEGNAVMCPWHAWRFSIEDGRWLDADTGKIRCGSYEVRIEDDEIQVRVPKIDGESGTPMS